MSQDMSVRRPLGNMGVDVPIIGIGCAPLANMPETFGFGVSEADALATIRTALASPLNYLDTAADYGDGECERRIGVVVRELGGLPDGAFLQSRVGADSNDNYSSEVIRRRFELSLDLLGQNRIELVFLHDPERTTFASAPAPDGLVDVMLDLKRQGMTGHIGIAGGPIDVMTQYVESGMFEAVITHNRYTLIDRVAEPLIQLATDRGLVVLNAAPYGNGILAKGPTAYPRYAYEEASRSTLEKAHAIEAICLRHDVPIAAAALQFSLRDPRITSTSVGMSNPRRVQQTLDLVRMPISDACWDELMAQPPEQGEPE